MTSSVKENYLKALYSLNKGDNLINVSDLSNKLGVSKPTVNKMIKSLEEQGWVIYRKYKPIELTKKGIKTAALIIRKHRLTEMFLHKVMGFGWEEVHQIAEQIEHIKSDAFFDRMDEMLDYPKVDPHGSPIPDAEGNVIEYQYRSLSETQVGQRVQLCALAKSSEDLLHYLNQNNIKIGTTIEIVRTEPFDNSCLIKCDDDPPIMISEKVVEQLLVMVL